MTRGAGKGRDEGRDYSHSAQLESMGEEEDGSTVVWIPNMINPKLIAPGALNERLDLDANGVEHDEAQNEVSKEHEGNESSEEEEESDGERNTSPRPRGAIPPSARHFPHR